MAGDLPNQHFGITRQLNDGIRGLMLDTYEEEGELLLCHELCSRGAQPLVEGLGEITAFLEANPNEVASIILESYITHAQTAEAFDESGLIDFVYAHEVGEPWPTLGELIEADTRLVVFQGGTQDAEFPWLMYFDDHAWETRTLLRRPEDFDCDPNRGDPANPLFLLNHFLTRGAGWQPEFAEMVNYNPLFIERASSAKKRASALPNFVAVGLLRHRGSVRGRRRAQRLLVRAVASRRFGLGSRRSAEFRPCSVAGHRRVALECWGGPGFAVQISAPGYGSSRSSP